MDIIEQIEDALAKHLSQTPWHIDANDHLCAGDNWALLLPYEHGDFTEGDLHLVVLLRNHADVLLAAMRLAQVYSAWRQCNAEDEQVNAALDAYRAAIEAVEDSTN